MILKITVWSIESHTYHWILKSEGSNKLILGKVQCCWVSSPSEMLVLPFHHVTVDVGWVNHSTIGNDWVWFGPSRSDLIYSCSNSILPMESQPIWSSCECPHHLKCFLCPSIMLLWMWDESITALLAMIGSGLVPIACWRSEQYRRDLIYSCSNLPQISANMVQLWVSSTSGMLVLPFHHVAVDVG